MEQRIETVPYGRGPPDGFFVYRAEHDKRVNARITEVNGEGWEVDELVNVRHGTQLLLKRRVV